MSSSMTDRHDELADPPSNTAKQSVSDDAAIVADEPTKETDGTTAVAVPTELVRYAADTQCRSNLGLDMAQRNVKLPLLSTLCGYVALLNTPLVSLTLSHNALGPTGATLLGRALVTNNTLQFLELEGCELIGSAYRPQYGGLKALAKGFESVRSTLRFVNVADNSLQPEGCRIVFGALSFHKTLTALDLSSNLLGLFNEIEGVLALSYTLRFARRLCWLATNQNPLSASSWKILCDSLADNTTLTSLHAVGSNLSPELSQVNPFVLTNVRK